MQSPPLRVLTLSDLYPRPRYPVLGVFVEEQTLHLKAHCDPVVVVPTRIFPPLRLFKNLPSLPKFRSAWQQWQADCDVIPQYAEVKGLPVYYPRYSSLPKQLYQGSWGLFAYASTRSLLAQLHRQYQFDIIHAHYASPAGMMALFAKRWLKVPVVLSVHGFDLAYTAQQGRLGAWIVKRVFEEVDVILANSQQTATRIAKYGGDPRKTHIVYLGGNAPSVTPLARPADKHGINLLTVGYLEKQKGYHIVLRALRQLHDEGFAFTYTMVGDGSYRPALEQLIVELGLTPYVRLAGYTAHDNVWPYYAASDIFVLPSHREGFGIVFLEALSQGIPVIGSTTGGAFDIHQYFPDGVELVEEEDVAGVAAALRTLILDEERRKRVRETAPAFINERFSWKKTAEETMKIYHQILDTYHTSSIDTQQARFLEMKG